MNRGFGLIEVILGVSVLAVSFFALLSIGRNVTRLSGDVTRSTQADFLLEEGLEAVRGMRDNSWAQNIGKFTSTTYLSFSTSTARWSTTTAPEIVGGLFYRSITMSNIYRDTSTDDITSGDCGGVLDYNAKKITVTVSWKASTATTTRSFSTYLTNFFDTLVTGSAVYQPLCA